MRVLPFMTWMAWLACAASFAGCTTLPTMDTNTMGPMEVRAMETRSYDGADYEATLKATLDVFQDEGFVVDFGNTDLGLLHATKTISATEQQAFTPAIADFSAVNVPPGRLALVTIQATANVTDLGQRVKVRVNFQRELAETIGLPAATITTAAPLSDPKTYQEFFAKLERGLFIQKQKLSY